MLFCGAFTQTDGVTEDAAWWSSLKKPFIARIAIPAIKRPANSQRKACFLGSRFGDCTAIWSSADRSSFGLRGDRFFHSWQSLLQFAWALEASASIFLQQDFQQRDHRCWNIHQFSSGQCSMLMLVHQLRDRAVERRLTRKHFPECHPQ